MGNKKTRNPKKNPYRKKFPIGICEFCQLETPVLKAKMTKLTEPDFSTEEVTICENCFYFKNNQNALPRFFGVI